VSAVGFYDNPKVAEGALMIEWLTKALQQSQNDGPPTSVSGWNYIVNNPSQLVVYPNAPALWNGVGAMPASQQTTLMNNYLTQWLSIATRFTRPQLAAGGYTAPIDAVLNATGGPLGDRIAFMIPQFLYWGADPSLINQVVTWAQSIWPGYNWARAATATCVPPVASGVLCSNDN
jgi:hypothetical protein